MSVKKKTSPVASLSRLFTSVLTVVILAIGALLFFAFKDLPPYAETVNQKLEQANLHPASNTPSTDTATLNKRASLFYSTTETYKEQAETDIRKYAQLTNIPIQSITPDGGNGGLQVVSVKLTGAVEYDDLLRFITATEGNLPNMKIQSLSMSASGGTSSGMVMVQTLKIGIAVR